jgi:hypothetical protein
MMFCTVRIRWKNISEPNRALNAISAAVILRGWQHLALSAHDRQTVAEVWTDGT